MPIGWLIILQKLRRSRQVKSTQLTGPLIAISGKCQFYKDAQSIRDASKLVGKLKHFPSASAIPLLMNAGDHLTAKALQQRIERLTDNIDIATSLALLKRSAEDLLTFFAGELIEKGVEACYRVALGQ
ncbi:hypothetical protein PssB301D_00504 [Pseudomonas syringae pv. syringae str. B301D-R]|nr:hypothetical protein PssB301D_00504 [Pseudomonas syringae pv. syringae str. B301D-R]